MQVKEILDKKGHRVVTIEPDRAATEATEIMVDNRIGAIVVAGEGGKIAGIISERDITKGVRDHGPAFFTKQVRDLMSSGVVTCAPDYRIGEIMTLMTSNSIRHLPVVDRDRLVGMISIRDVMENSVQVLQEENGSLRELLVQLK